MKRIPKLRGLIRRRLLVNFRVDPEVMRTHLPLPFRPKLLDHSAVAGICLIRLEQIRPRLLAWPIGLSSENAAHRVAVCWTEPSGVEKEGVYISRRDSDSIWNRLAGGRLFPGVHHKARFDVDETRERIDLLMRSADGRTAVQIRARTADSLAPMSRFSSLKEASDFFERGSLGYSPTSDSERLDGLYLCTRSWKVEPLDLEYVYSSFFADEDLFPKGSVQFDSALLMRDIPHEWRAAPDLRIETAPQSESSPHRTPARNSRISTENSEPGD